MKKSKIKSLSLRLISAFVTAAMLFSLIPLGVFAEGEPYSLSDGFIEVTVSEKNGGFNVRTVKGDKLIKSDDNKDLLYHNDDYDTSFTSFQVTYSDGSVKEYLFGGSYGFLGINSSDVRTTQNGEGISSEWTVDGLTFTQRIELAGDASAEHGMVLITYDVASVKEETVSVKARVLMDTALGKQDFACYEVVDQYGQYRSVENETIISDYIPANFFGYDNVLAPEITAYTVNSTKPYQLAFGHWNNLASTMFDFTPNPSMYFTNRYNEQYLTADSAMALYYDLGEVSPSAGASLSTYYGVYSNNPVSSADSVAVNVSGPSKLELSADGKSYVSTVSGMTSGVFAVQTQVNNFISDTAKMYRQVTVAAYAANGIEPLDDMGNPLSETPTYLDPYRAVYNDFAVGQTQTRNFYFKAAVGGVSEYRKVELRVFDTSNEYDKTLTEDKLIGSRSMYILCPGGDGKLPEVTFTSMKPEIVYNQGKRNLYIAGNNFNMLVDKGQYAVRAYNKSDRSVYYDIPSEQISFSETEGENTINVTMTDTMRAGTYELTFDWIGQPPEGAKKSMTAPALTFVVSDDKVYKNDYYGVAAIVQEGKGGESKYRIKTYTTEKQFEEDKNNYAEVLLVFKGSFDVKHKVGTEPVILKATSVKSTGGKADNQIVINDCVDFENGSITISRLDDSVVVDFEGDLYTSVKRSKIWSGNAAFTELSDGIDFGLVPYNGDGERMEGYTDMPITLLWPCGLSIAQTISGMAFNMTFGSMGIKYDTNAKRVSELNSSTKVDGKVISFSASLDLSFLIPNAKSKSLEDIEWKKIQSEFNVVGDTAAELRNRWQINKFGYKSYVSQANEAHMRSRNSEGQASVMVDDILYGCGKGLLGVKFVADLTLPPYTTAMPCIGGTLSVNTIGGYEIGVDGMCQFATLDLEASIRIKDHNGTPIPDKLYFYIAGFEPGINIDGFGVVWITGGGGGFDNLYDTLFAGSSVPPLKLLLSVSFDVLKVLSSRVDLSLSLRGISLTARDVKIKYTGITVIRRLGLSFEWYPDFYFMANVDAYIYGIIRGQGYIVVLNNDQYKGFVEFFIRAGVQIPDEIPLIGGLELGSIDLGANNRKIWGVARALGAEIGVTYYWGGDVDFGTGKSVSKPSFPSLLGYEDIPVYYDEENQRTLYMRGGTNLSLASTAQIADRNAKELPVLLSNEHSIQSMLNKKTHKLTLGAFNDTNAAFTVTYSADSEEKAREYANAVTVEGKQLTFYEYNSDTQTGNEDTANSNFTYNSETKRAVVSVVMSDESDFNRSWDITTPVESDLVLYNIDPMPQLDLGATAISGDSIDISWDGSMLDSLDSVSFMLTTDPNGNPEAESYALGSLTEAYEITAKSVSYPVPSNLKSGDYYVKAVYSQEDYVNETVMGTQLLSWSNANQPQAPSEVTARNGGDYMLDFDVVKADAADFDGYLVNVYKADGELTDISNLTFEKDGEGNLPKLEAGGYFDAPVTDENGERTGTQKTGLAPNNAYYVGVSAYKNVKDADGNVLYQVCSDEIRTASPVTLKEPTTPNVTLSALTSYQTLFRSQEGVEERIEIDTFSSENVQFKVGSDVPANGTWVLNGEVSGSFANEGTITFTDLEDGDYQLVLYGEDNDGDGFRTVKNFAVDTLAPVLLLSSPVNGGFFDQDGSVTVSGITDDNARFTVYVDGLLMADGKTVSELGGEIDSSGKFSFVLAGEAAVGGKTVTISVKDDMQNVSETTTATVYNKGLASIKSLSIYADGKIFEDGNLPIGESGLSATLSLAANTDHGTFLFDDSRLVEWSAVSTLGSMAVDDNGILTASAGSLGVVTGSLRVADENAEAISSGEIDTTRMNTSVTVGAENHTVPEDKHTVSLSAGVGGTVSGSGVYDEGATVSITATPNSGYKFSGWKISGGNVVLQDSSAQSTSFTMPPENVIISAAFRKNSSANSVVNTVTRKPVDKAGTVSGKAGNVYSFNLPQNANGSLYAPCYYENGQKKYVRMSGAEGGQLWFVAPRDAVYYLEECSVSFADTAGHWAEDNINFSAARNLFEGVTDTLFSPDEPMTRAMFVTVLSRLAQADLDGYTTSEFDDVGLGEWYSKAVAWASENGIVTGYGDGRFGPYDIVTREQICTILLRYLNFAGYSAALDEPSAAFADSGEISDWAAQAVDYCKRAGFVQGRGENLFAPRESSTRAEVCTVLRRLISAVIARKK